MRVLRTAADSECFTQWRSHFSLSALRNVRSSTHTAKKMSAELRERKAAKDMAHRKLTIEAQLKGVRAALRSPRTPPQLRKGLRKREQDLSKIAGRSRSRKKRSVVSGLFK